MHHKGAETLILYRYATKRFSSVVVSSARKNIQTEKVLASAMTISFTIYGHSRVVS